MANMLLILKILFFSGAFNITVNILTANLTRNNRIVHFTFVTFITTTQRNKHELVGRLAM